MSKSQHALVENGGSLLPSIISEGNSSCCGLSHRQERQQGDEDVVQKELAQALSALSVDERNQAYEDLHGVATLPVEEATEMENLRKAILQEVKRLPFRQRALFDQAAFLSPHAVLDPSFLNMFLRATNYKVDAAATKLCGYFEAKQLLFPHVPLGRTRILFSDLSEEDIQVVYGGTCRPCLTKDVRGRTIYFISPFMHPWKDPMNLLRKLFYVIPKIVSQDPLIQQQGLVQIFWFRDQGRIDADRLVKVFSLAKKVLPGIPYKVSAMHVCYDSVQWMPVLSILARIVGSVRKVRIRVHYGSLVENLYALQSFGIPMESLPLSRVDGSLCIGQDFVNTIQEWQWQEGMTLFDKSNDAVEYPTDHDVLLGRGRRHQEHAGNMTLGQLVSRYQDLHRQSDDLGGKADICDRIRLEIQQGGGRFLKRQDDSELWRIVSDKEARLKISVVFRTKTKMLLRKQNRFSASARST